MQHFLRLSINAFLFVWCFSLAQSKQCSGAYFTRAFNKRLICGLFKTISAQQIDCHKACRGTVSCFSVNVYESDNGTDVCEMSRGTRATYARESHCFEWQDNCEHNELRTIDSCSTSPDCPFSSRQALSEGWYKLGSLAFKLFKTKKTYADANATCTANGATLATIDNEVEKQYIDEVHLAQLKEKTLQGTVLAPLHHWKLDGNDKDIKLYGDATYDHTYAALNLPGLAGAYATSPAFPIQTMSFTIAFWIRVESCLNQNYYVYSYWQSPFIFTLTVSGGSSKCVMSFAARSKLDSNRDMIVGGGGSVVGKQWTHAAAAWNRTTKTIHVYQDGVVIKAATISDADVDLPTPTRSVFDIGFKRDTSGTIKAKLKDLTVFSRALTAQEIALLRDTTGIELKGAWIGPPASSLSNWLPVLTASSQCIFADVHQMKWDKRDCNDEREFICEKHL